MIKSTVIAGFDITICPVSDIPELGSKWKSIQNRSRSTPSFLSWQWISCWLKTYQPKTLVVLTEKQGDPICVGLFTQSKVTRHGFIVSRQLRLNQTGIQEEDQIWVEYNDLLCIDEYREVAPLACLEAIQQLIEWDEIVISMAHHSRVATLMRKFPNSRIEMQHDRFSVNLESLEKDPSAYLAGLSSNTRYQIRRSARLYEQRFGVLSLESPDTTEDALEFFHEAGSLHKQRWPDSGFLNHDFTRFHENLITETFTEGFTQFLRLKAGDKTLAVIYYQVLDGVAYFYLHGLNYEQDQKFKPGLLAHAMAIEHFRTQRLRCYDFMGGANQYKIQLAQRDEPLQTLVIQRPLSRFWLEDILRRIKNRIIPASKPVNET
jgi:CelD/BcsL family acetyltransferase involved in cellulose biosynthesis